MATEDHNYPMSWDWANYYAEQQGVNLRIPKPKARRRERTRVKRERLLSERNKQ